MNCVSAMITVLMDGLKDTEMLLDYFKKAKSESKTEEAEWFKGHAKRRMEFVISDFDYIKRAINLEERIRQGDPIADALHQHIIYQIDALKKCMD